jgi:DNA-binding PadR family transcriptional regulator
LSTRLVILGLLRSRPLHGYEIKRTIEEHMGDWTSVAFGSIYFALQKLTEEGAIEIAATEREGGRPSRTVYAITANGRLEFHRLLREAWLAVERPAYVVDLALFFMDAMSEDEIRAHLEQRVAQLVETQEWVEQHRTETLASQEVPPQAAAIFEHTRKHLVAELSWTKETLDALDTGNLLPARPKSQRLRSQRPKSQRRTAKETS